MAGSCQQLDPRRRGGDARNTPQKAARAEDGIILGDPDKRSLTKFKLLTAPGHAIGVWLPRSRRHGLLVGQGSSRPELRLIESDPDVRPGDLVSTSPASTLLPPNLPVGVVQSVKGRAIPAPTAVIQLIAAPEAIDWVQVRTR